MKFGQRIRHLMLDRNVSVTQLAASCEMSTQNLHQKLKRDDFRESEMQQIADVLGMELEIKLVPKQQP